MTTRNLVIWKPSGHLTLARERIYELFFHDASTLLCAVKGNGKVIVLRGCHTTKFDDFSLYNKEQMAPNRVAFGQEM
jgi:hypothetical protein